MVQPSGEFRTEQEIGQVVMDVQNGYPVYLRDLADIVRGYEDPPNVMNFRTVKVDAHHPPTARLPGEPPSHASIAGHEEPQRRPAARTSTACKPPAPSRWPSGRSKG